MDYVRLRRAMINRTIVARGIKSTRVLEAMAAVPREEFVLADQREQAYEDNPLPIGAGQTISQPYIVALTASALNIQPTDKVLDIGTGCGYAAAVLAELGKELHSVERVPSLAISARETLKRLGYSKITVHIGDGTLGLPEHAPFNAIAVAAGSPGIPESLIKQLAEGGRIVIPVEGEDGFQELILGTRQGTELTMKNLGGVRFVPLIGEEGFKHA